MISDLRYNIKPTCYIKRFFGYGQFTLVVVITDYNGQSELISTYHETAYDAQEYFFDVYQYEIDFARTNERFLYDAEL